MPAQARYIRGWKHKREVKRMVKVQIGFVMPVINSRSVYSHKNPLLLSLKPRFLFAYQIPEYSYILLCIQSSILHPTPQSRAHLSFKRFHQGCPSRTKNWAPNRCTEPIFKSFKRAHLKNSINFVYQQTLNLI